MVLKILLSLIINAIAVGIFIANNSEKMDYYIVFIMISGVFIFYNVLTFLKRRDYFAPSGILSVVMYYFFIIAPMMHINYGYYYPYFYDSYDEWFSKYNHWAFLNLLGLMLYYITMFICSKKFNNVEKKRAIYFSDIKENIFYFLIGVVLITSLIFQILIYQKFGGIYNYILAKELYGLEAFSGLGKYALIAESFPIMVMFLVAYIYRNRSNVRIVEVLTIICVFLFLKFIFGGLSGSRSNIVWALFWCFGIITFYIRRLSLAFYSVSLIFLVLFMLTYGVYKKHGSDFMNAIQTTGISSNNYKSENTDSVLLMSLMTDFSRADIQTFSIYSQSKGTYTNLRWGETYIASLLMFMPSDFLSLERKATPGAEILHNVSNTQTTRVFGMVGEFIINYPYQIYPIAFILLSIIVFKIDKYYFGLEKRDIRFIISPFLANLCIVLLISDSDNIMFFLLKNGVMPMLFIKLLVLMSKKNGKKYELNKG